MSFSLRPAVLDDVAELAALHVQCWKQTYIELLPAGFFDEAHEQQRVSQWQRTLAEHRPDFHAYVASDGNGALIGFALAAPCSNDDLGVPDGIARQLYNLYLLREHHGSGAGQQLLDAVLDQQPALLWVAEQNPRAIAFYQRNGFEFDGPSVQDPTAPLITDLRMVRLPASHIAL